MKNSNTLHLEILLSMCKQVSSEYSKLVQHALASGGFLNALRVKMPKPEEYSTHNSFRDDYLISNYLSKFEGSTNLKTLENEAILQFKETEGRLLDVNRHLRSGSCNAGVEGIISDARRKISAILGYGNHLKDSFNLNEFAACVDWGPGATATLKSTDCTMDKKILEPRLGVTRRALRYALAYLRFDTSFVSARLGFQSEQCTLLPSEFYIDESDRFTTVPKSYKSRRSICIQPTLNLFFQKAIGRMIRKRLQRDGINLDDQSRNQKLASEAYAKGFATIDLARASDSVSTELVRLLMPNDWFEHMDNLRTRSTNIDSEVHTLNKFSAMGNGFTFELESLIFYALSWACVRCEADDRESEIAVYGDDIIVHSRHAERLIAVLKYCGFETNVDKTFVSGPFYESCGKHFFTGLEVTPVYQKKALTTLPEIIRAHNRLYRWSVRNEWFDKRFSDIFVRLSYEANKLLDTFSKRKMCRVKVPVIPWWLEGDDGLLTNDKFVADKHGILHIKVLSFVPLKVKAENYALLATSLRKGVVVSSPYNGLLSKRGVGKFQFRVRRVYRTRADVLMEI